MNFFFQIIKKIRIRFDDFKFEDIVIGPGTKELMFLTQIIFEGEILWLIPCLGRKAIDFPFNDPTHTFDDGLPKEDLTDFHFIFLRFGIL